MAGLNGVVIRFFAETGQAVTNIGKLERATGRVSDSGKRAKAIWSKVGPALATGAIAAGVAIGAAAVKGIQSAIEDEQSQKRLSQAMKTLLGATDQQVAAMEDYITVAQKKSGLDDGDMRTGLTRLLRSTKSTTRAQSIMNTAMEISAATGKPLAQVVESLAKFNDGNAGALKRLGITMGPVTQNYSDMLTATKQLSKAQEEADRVLDTYGPNSDEYAKAVEKVNTQLDKVKAIKGQGGVKWIAELNKQFDGSVAAQADTYAGKMERISTAYDELLEAFGAGLIGDLGGANDALGSFDDVLYDLQPTAEDIGQIVAAIATSMATTAQYIGPVVDKLTELNNMGDGFLTNGVFANTMKAINGDFNIPGYTRNVRPDDAPSRTPAQLADIFANSPNNPAYWGDFYAQGAGPRSVDPLRYKTRSQDADARARARGASSRGNP